MASRAPISPFPASALPDWLRDHVEAVSTSIQTPVDLPGMLALAVVAGGIARKIKIRVRLDFDEPTNLYVLESSESGERKSVVFREMLQPIFDFEKNFRKHSRAYVRASETERRIKEHELHAAERAAARADAAQRPQRIEEAKKLARELTAMDSPSVPRLVTGDVSPARLEEMLAENGERMMLASPEGSEVLPVVKGALSRSFVSKLEVFLKGYTGERHVVDRLERSITLDQPALTLALAVQPVALEALMKNSVARKRGLHARFLYTMTDGHAMPPSGTPPPPIPTEVATRYARNLQQVWATQYHQDLELAAPAKARFGKFESWVNLQLKPGGELYPIKDWGRKLVGQTARIAAVLHVADDPKAAVGKASVDVDVVERAIEIASYLVPHARQAHALAGDHGSNRVHAASDKIRAGMLNDQADSFCRQDVERWLNCSTPTASRRLAELKKSDLIEGAGKRGRAPYYRFV